MLAGAKNEQINVRMCNSVACLCCGFPGGTAGTGGRRRKSHRSITDAAGAVVAGATVTLTNDATGVKLNTKSNEVGSYTFSNLNPGRYTLFTEMAGFAPVSLTGIIVTVAQFARADVQLKVGAVSERIEVQATAGVVETERPTLSAVITQAQITQLPFDGRYNLSGLIALAPGVQRGGRFASGGPLTGGLNVVVDGAENLDMQNGGPSAAQPTFDSIAEFRFISNTASAEYSHGTAQLIAVTRSGTNELHGSAFWFNRNREFAAKYALDARPKPPFNRNEFGGTAGGKIIKDKLFYFFSYEQLSLRQWATNTHIMATPAEKQGDFTGLKVITDPLSNLPFPGNRIPSERISSVSQFFMGYMRDPNTAGSGPMGTGVNFISRNLTSQDSPRFNIRGDYNPTSSDMLSGGVKIFNDGPHIYSGGGPELYGNYTQGFVQRQEYGAYTKVFSPRLTNELRGAVTTPYGYHFTNTLSDVVDPVKIFPTLAGQCCADLKSPDKDYVGPFGGGLPGVNMTGYQNIFTNGAHAKDNRLDINISDNVLFIKGAHQIKIGAYYYRYQGYWGGIYPHGLGIFNFTGRYTGDAFADFLLGFANDSQRGPAYQWGNFNEKRFGAFFQDDWQLHRNLTLNLGVRWDVETPYTEKNSRQDNYIPELNSLVTFSGTDKFPDGVVTRLVQSYPVITSVQAGLGTTRLTRDTNWKNFQPRVGFAWRPFGNNKTVVRAGGGIYYAYQASNQLGLRQVLYAPFALIETFLSPPGAQPYVTFADPFPGVGNIPSSPSILGMPRRFPNPQSIQWNLTVEREVARNTSLRISYVGDQDHYAPSEYDLNLPRNFGAGTLQALRPFQPWGDIRWIDPRGNAHVHQLQIGSTRRAGDLTYQLEYQFTSAITDGAGVAQGWSDTGGIDWPFDSARNRGPEDAIVRHQMIANWIYNLPVGKGRRFLAGIPAAANYVLGGWQISGIATMRTGTPFHVSYTSALVGFPSSGRADVIGDWHVSNPGVGGWFNPAAFRAPAPFTLGNVGRNSMWTPGFWNLDTGIMKNFRFHERFDVQLRGEFFNLFNHPNPGAPGANLSVASTVRQNHQLHHAKGHSVWVEIRILMSPVERCLKTIRHEVPDRVPVVPLIIHHTVKLGGVAFCEYAQNPELIVKCQAAAWKEYGYDGIHVTTDNWILPQALGVEVQFYTDLPPTGLRRPLAGTKDLSALPRLEAARSAARMGLLPAATSYARSQLGDTCFIKSNFDQGPFSLCTAVRGIEALMMDLHEDPQFVFDLLEISTEMVYHLGLSVGRAGAHAITFGDSVAGLLSRKDFEEYAYPFEKEVIRRLHAALDVPVFLHICGKAAHILDLMAGTGADAIELDHFNDFAKVKRQVGGTTCLEGNLDPSSVLLQGTPALVRAESEKLIRAAAQGGGFILSSGCEMARDTPPENIRAMVEAAAEFGTYGNDY